MEHWPLEWFGWAMDQCWEEVWFFWRSSRVRDQLVCKQGGVNPIPATDTECEVWACWKQELVSEATAQGR